MVRAVNARRRLLLVLVVAVLPTALGCAPGLTAATADTTPPSLPSGLTAAATGTRSVVLTWNAVSDPDDSPLSLTYEIYRYGRWIASVPGSASLSWTDTSLRPGTSASYHLLARDPAGNLSAPSARVWVTTDSDPVTVADWHMDEPAGATRMHDTTPRHNDGTLTGVSAGAAGYEGTAFSFVPKGFVTVRSSASLDPGYRNISIRLHIRTPSRPSYGDYDILRKGKSPGIEYKVELLKSGRILCTFHGGAGGTKTNGIGVRSTGPSLADDRWHTVTCARTGYGTVTLVVDGTQYTATLAHHTSLGKVSPLRALYLGANPVARNDYYRGLLDDVSIRVG